jgi:hypothetical protein
LVVTVGPEHFAAAVAAAFLFVSMLYLHYRIAQVSVVVRTNLTASMT